MIAQADYSNRIMRWMGNAKLVVGSALLSFRALIALPFLADAVMKIIYLPQQVVFFEDRTSARGCGLSGDSLSKPCCGLGLLVGLSCSAFALTILFYLGLYARLRAA